MLYEIRDGSVSQQGEPVLSHFDFWIRGTEKIAIVGRNGAGKSTLLEAIAGEKEIEINRKNPASGVFRSRAFTVGVLRQQACENPDETVEDCILKGVKALPDCIRGSGMILNSGMTASSRGSGFRWRIRRKSWARFPAGSRRRSA